MTKKTSRIIATIMLVLAIAYVAYALAHPSGSFPWSNKVTYLIYGAYIGVMAVLFIGPAEKK